MLALIKAIAFIARRLFPDFKKDHNVIIAELDNLGVHPVVIRWNRPRIMS